VKTFALYFILIGAIAKADEGFFPAKNDAIVALQTPSMTCTGFFISPNGHIMTAMHCFRKTLILEYLVTDTDTFDRSFSAYKIRSGRAVGYSVEIGVNGKTFLATIEAIGTGFMQIASGNTVPSESKTFNELRDNGYGPDQDYIVLKIDAPTNFIPYTIGTLDKNKITTIGFPAETNRPNGKNADGKNQFFSSGNYNSKAQDNFCLKKLYAQQRPEEIPGVDRYLNAKGTFWTTLDAVPGSSGAPVFNKQKKLIGMVISVTDDAGGTQLSTKYCGATQVVKLPKLEFSP
jgi:hypothetical protein